MTIELGVFISVLGVVIAYQGYKLNQQKHATQQTKEEKEDVRSDAKENAEIRAQLGYIIKGVDDIRLDIRDNQRQTVALGERVTRVEESTKQAHKRIDNLDKESV